MNCKREYQSSPNVLNTSRFLDNRSFFAKVKREAKRKFYYKERSTLSKLSKNPPCKLWKYLNKFKRKSKNDQNVGMQDFVNYFNDNTTTDDAGSVNAGSNDGLDTGGRWVAMTFTIRIEKKKKKKKKKDSTLFL